MNNRPVEQALATLLPTHADDMPHELVSLARALLAQSRSYAASLKPEEEIARPWACAEIACKRLSRALKLPPLLGNPPCPPRVYKKLLAYLEQNLKDTSSARRRPREPLSSRTATPSTPTKATTTSAAKTPTRSAAPRTVHNTPSKGTPSKTRTQGTKQSDTEISNAWQNIPDAPTWVMPSIRTVCKTMATPAPRMSLWSRPPISQTFPPHIFAGVSSILHFVMSSEDADFDADFLDILRNPRAKETDDYKKRVYTLIVAVYFLVLARRRSSDPMTVAATYTEKRSESQNNAEEPTMDKKTYTEMRQTALSSLGFEPVNAKQLGQDVDTWIALIEEHNWAKDQEWYQNIPLAGENDAADHEHGLYAHRYEDDEAENNPIVKRQRTAKRSYLDLYRQKGEGVLLPGLGTMMQPRVDYLSEDRKEDYQAWKEDILNRIRDMERREKRKANTTGKRATVAA